MKKVFLFVLSISLFISTNTFSQSKKELKKQKQEEEYQATKKIVESKTFVFVPGWVTTQKGRRINVSGDGYTLKVENSTTSADLPYFGQAQNVSYGGGGIEFSNINTEINIEPNDKKSKIIIKFSAQEKSENFDIYLTVFSNKNASLNISSSGRNSINFDGEIKEISSKEED